MAWQHPRRRDLLITDVGLEEAPRAAGNRPTIRAGVTRRGGGRPAEEPGKDCGRGRAARPRRTGQATGGGGAKQPGRTAPAIEASGTSGSGAMCHRRLGGGCGARGDERPRGRMAAWSRHGRRRRRLVTVTDRCTGAGPPRGGEQQCRAGRTGAHGGRRLSFASTGGAVWAPGGEREREWALRRLEGPCGPRVWGVSGGLAVRTAAARAVYNADRGGRRGEAGATQGLYSRPLATVRDRARLHLAGERRAGWTSTGDWLPVAAVPAASRDTAVRVSRQAHVSSVPHRAVGAPHGTQSDWLGERTHLAPAGSTASMVAATAVEPHPTWCCLERLWRAGPLALRSASVHVQGFCSVTW